MTKRDVFETRCIVVTKHTCYTYCSGGLNITSIIVKTPLDVPASVTGVLKSLNIQRA